jgi:hypothetical protein
VSNAEVALTSGLCAETLPDQVMSCEACASTGPKPQTMCKIHVQNPAPGSIYMLLVLGGWLALCGG